MKKTSFKIFASVFTRDEELPKISYNIFGAKRQKDKLLFCNLCLPVASPINASYINFTTRKAVMWINGITF